MGRSRKTDNVPIAFVAYFNTLKLLCGYGALKKWADFCGCSPAWLTRLATGKFRIPLDIGIKTAIYSCGKVDLIDLCPYLKDDLPIIARQQLIRESRQNKEKTIDLSIHYKETDDLTHKQVSEFLTPFKILGLTELNDNNDLGANSNDKSGKTS